MQTEQANCFVYWTDENGVDSYRQDTRSLRPTLVTMTQAFRIRANLMQQQAGLEAAGRRRTIHRVYIKENI